MELFFGGIVVVVIAYSVWKAITYSGRKRRNELTALAGKLGLQFSYQKDYSLDEQYSFLNKLCKGRNRYGENVLHGHYRGHPVLAFDYHYETKSNDSTTHHRFSFLILQYNADFPELIICQEGWFSKITQFFGFDDIDFESAEFSNAFLVKSPDKRFAYDICHAKMIEFMLANRDLSIEMERHCLTLCFDSRLSPQAIQYNLDRIVNLREMFPKYLLEQR